MSAAQLQKLKEKQAAVDEATQAQFETENEKIRKVNPNLVAARQEPETEDKEPVQDDAKTKNEVAKKPKDLQPVALPVPYVSQHSFSIPTFSVTQILEFIFLFALILAFMVLTLFEEYESADDEIENFERPLVVKETAGWGYGLSLLVLFLTFGSYGMSRVELQKQGKARGWMRLFKIMYSFLYTWLFVITVALLLYGAFHENYTEELRVEKANSAVSGALVAFIVMSFIPKFKYIFWKSDENTTDDASERAYQRTTNLLTVLFNIGSLGLAGALLLLVFAFNSKNDSDS